MAILRCGLILSCTGGAELVLAKIMTHLQDTTNREVMGRLFPCLLEIPAGPVEAWSRLLPARGAVYALEDENGRLIQLLGTESLRKGVGARLRSPDSGESGKRANLGNIARQVWWRPTYSVFETKLVHLQIARQLLGPSYKKELSFGPAWFASVTLEDQRPRWVASALGFKRGAVSVGPFETRKLCEKYIGLLEDLFDLCRDYRILQQAPHGQACAYRDMGKCPAPCDGSISMDEYRQMLQESSSFATGKTTGTLIATLETDMKNASAKMDYERAGQLREKQEKARKLESFDGRMGLEADRFDYLILQAGRRASTVRPFFLKAGSLHRGDEVHKRDCRRGARAWADTMQQSDKGMTRCGTFASDCVSLVCHFLRKNAARPGVYLGIPGCTDESSIIEAIEKELGWRSG